MTKSNNSTKSQKTPKAQDSTKAQDAAKSVVCSKPQNTAKPQSAAKTETAEALPPTTTEARAAGGEAGRKRREVYRQIKAFAVEHEKTNYSKLFVFHDRSNW